MPLDLTRPECPVTITHEELIVKAHKAAADAILQYYKDGHREQPFNCGFAWVQCDLRNPFTRWCKKQVTNGDRGYYGGDGYPSGWRFFCPGYWPKQASLLALGVEKAYQQDVDFHRAGAGAFCQVLQVQGLKCWVESRLD